MDFFNKGRNHCHKVLSHLVDRMSLTAYSFIYCAVIIAAGFSYWCLTPGPNGIEEHGVPLIGATLWDGLYFSIVTIGTLGYGDMAPLGWSRAIACFELLFGIGFVGIAIARITSRRLGHHVERLFAADAQSRLDDFTERFLESTSKIRELLQEVGKAVQPTPGTPGAVGSPVPSSSQLRDAAEALLANLQADTKALADYFALEVANGEYFGILPEEPVCALARSMDRIVLLLGQLVLVTEGRLREEIFMSGGTASERLFVTLSHKSKVCSIVLERVKAEQVVQLFRKVSRLCENFDQNYGIQRAVDTPEAPDQVKQGTVVPPSPPAHGSGV